MHSDAQVNKFLPSNLTTTSLQCCAIPRLLHLHVCHLPLLSHKCFFKTSHPQQCLLKETNQISTIRRNRRLRLPLPETVVVVNISLCLLCFKYHTLLLPHRFHHLFHWLCPLSLPSRWHISLHQQCMVHPFLCRRQFLEQWQRLLHRRCL